MLAFDYLSRQRREGCEWLSFAKLLWPFVFVQGEASNHVLVDEVGLLGLSIDLTNPPRTARVGHIIRDPSLTQAEKLDRVLEVLTYTDDVEVRAPDEVESFRLEIPGLTKPSLLAVFGKMLRHVRKLPIDHAGVIDSTISTERALDLSGEYRKALEVTRGNAMRWKSLVPLLKEPFERWILDFKVKLKEAEERFASDISKTDRLIDDSWIQDRVNEEKDKLDMWVLRQKKGVLKKMVDVLRPLDLIFEELRKHDLKLLGSDAIVGMSERDVRALTLQQLERIEAVLPNLHDKLEEAKKNFQERAEQLVEIERKAAQRLEQVQREFEEMLKNKELTIEDIKKQREKAVQEIRDQIALLEDKFAQILKKINEYADRCLEETQLLEEWAITDNETSFTQPVVRVYLPVYCAIFEDEEGEEKLELVFPSYVESTGSGVELKPLSPEFEKFGADIAVQLEEDVRKLTNFEFACEQNDLLNSDGLGPKLFAAGVRKLQNLTPSGWLERVKRQYEEMKK
ncbi:MAG: hypothetical protein Kow0069_21630 [Promethearchaeota archaeon]